MTSNNPFTDEAGDQVLRFVSAARNLSRLGELTGEVVTIALSGAWLRYRTATGPAEWRECELDYIIAARGVSDRVERTTSLATRSPSSTYSPGWERSREPARQHLDHRGPLPFGRRRELGIVCYHPAFSR